MSAEAKVSRAAAEKEWMAQWAGAASVTCGRFVYTNSMNRQWGTSKKVVKSIRFPISRSERHWHTIDFEDPVTECAAIEAAEQYMSEPMTKEHWELVRDDVLYRERTDEWDASWKDIKGHATGDLRFLEIVAWNCKTGRLALGLGS